MFLTGQQGQQGLPRLGRKAPEESEEDSKVYRAWRAQTSEEPKPLWYSLKVTRLHSKRGGNRIDLALPRYIQALCVHVFSFHFFSFKLLLATSSQSATFDAPFMRRNTMNILMNWRDLSDSNLGVVAWCCSEHPIQTACGAKWKATLKHAKRKQAGNHQSVRSSGSLVWWIAFVSKFKNFIRHSMKKLAWGWNISPLCMAETSTCPKSYSMRKIFGICLANMGSSVWQRDSAQAKTVSCAFTTAP